MGVPVLVGIDLGTSGVKVVALGLDGVVHAEAAREYPVHSSAPGQAETHPEDWWDAVVAALGEALSCGALEVAGVGLDGQMHGLALADEDGSPVRPALLWADSRATSEVSAWEELPGPIRHRLANPLSPGMAGPLLLWVRRNEPAAYERAHAALLPKDWLRHRLTGGEFATDPSDASATLLWDVPGDGWAEDVVTKVGLDAALLPPVRPSGARAGALSGAGLSGVDAGVPVAVGAADTAAALLATGLTDPKDLQISVGTGAQIVRPVRDPVVTPHPRTHLYRSAAKDNRWYAMAAVQNAGLALGWARRVLGLSWEELYAAADGPPGAGGVTFVPYLTGERSPVLSAQARGAWLGLDLASDRASLAQAAVEGVAFAIRHALEALPSAPLEHARLVGGGTTAPGFRTLLADVLGIPLRPVGVRSASAVGAAMLAAQAAGLPMPPPPVTTDAVVAPTGRAGRYEGPYQRYRDHAESLAGARSP
jgi:xylulokinase